MRKLSFLLLLFLLTTAQTFAQRTITGKVAGAEDGNPIPGVTVQVKGTTLVGLTDIDGKYSIAGVPKTATSLLFTFVGMKPLEVALNASNNYDVTLETAAEQIEGVVVTALGIQREKKSLGYATQDVQGDNISAVKSSNFINALSGKVAGVQIKKSNNMGGSTNVVMRGSKSLLNTNQVLYVVDGVPLANQIGSYSGQNTGGVGYDYGNAAADINPDDIESVNVLKGSAATALYGSRAAAGVIMITTKKGNVNKKGIGITINSSVNFTSIDKSTFPIFQDQYGAGYGPNYGPTKKGWFDKRTTSGSLTTSDPQNDPLVDWVPMREDASYGGKFDGHPVWGWYSVDPESPWYKQSKPWLAAKNGPITFFTPPTTYTNTIAIDNVTDKSVARLSYTNYNTGGLMPNSKLNKNTFLANGSWHVTSKLTASMSANFTRQAATGRNSTGYNDNIVSNMRQWLETNMDYADQKEAYFKTKRNLTWNYNPTLDYPIYTDNPYWQRYENYENDSRNRTVANIALDYKVLSWLDVFGRVSVDTYFEKNEERRAVGSIATAFGVSRDRQKSGYLRRDISFSEYNYDVMLKFNRNLTPDLNLNGLVGSNIRRTNYSRITSSTNGGLTVARVYSLQNSVSPLPYPSELDSRVGVDGLYASASLGYKNMLYLDGTFRRDHASTLPAENAIYYYPSVTGAFVFSELLKEKWLSFGKVRLNYAVVGNLADYDQLLDKYSALTPMGGPIFVMPATKNNPKLKNETTKSLEAGLEMYFFNRRLGFDLALYKTNSIDQIMPVTLSQTTGYASMYVNSGEIENKGLELTINASPVKTNDFTWDVSLNFSTYKSKVVDLFQGVDNVVIASYQGGVTVNATKGEPYGVLKGKDYTYYQGKKIISASSGLPIKTSTATENLGNINPDWIGGIHNTFSYKGLSLGFLIDMQHGGDLFSLDMYYGLSSGLYPETVIKNDLGNPVRDPLVFNQYDAKGNGIPSGGYASNSGGYIIEGVNLVKDANGNTSSTPNVTRVNAVSSDGFGYAVEPHRAFIYDASYVKLREVSLSYNLPSKWMQKIFIKGATVSFVGSNLWIIHKNLPYADPEAGLAAGNAQGFSIGSLPSLRDFGFNLKFNF